MSGNLDYSVSVVLPARNEAGGLAVVLPRLKSVVPDAEILVIDDGSEDDTVEIAEREGARVLRHPYSKGNGAAIKTGARNAQGEVIVFMDADGQHEPEAVPCLLERISEGYDMVVGARDFAGQASVGRWLANGFYNRLASWMTGTRIADLTSGFRAVRARHFRRFLYLLPNGFSYPTTSTMAFFRSGLSVCYVPIRVQQRHGRSHIRLLRDGLRFLVIVLKVGVLFSPMRLFLPVSAALFLSGITYYAYTFFTMHRFTNMSALLFVSALLTFLIGILSEQVSALHYRDSEDSDHG